MNESMNKKKNSKIKSIFCHQIPERSFFFLNRQFPICSRCTGIYTGIFTLPFFHHGTINPSILFIIIFAIPAVIDSITQALNWRKSNNKLRFITGLMGGISMAALIVFIGKFNF